MDLDSESKLISLITQLLSLRDGIDWEFKSPVIQVIRLVGSLHLESQPKPESKFMSLIIQTKSLFESMDLDSQPKPLSKLISCFTELVNYTNSYSSEVDADESFSLCLQTFNLEPEPELISLIYQIFSLVSCWMMKSKNLISICPQAQVRLGDDNVLRAQFPVKYNKWECFNMDGEESKVPGEDGSSYFVCRACKGQNHEWFTDEIKHPLHPKHSLQLVYLETNDRQRKCYCCDENLDKLIYCCVACNLALNLACVKKPPVFSIDRLKRHEHRLDLFSRTTSLICDVCGLVDSTDQIYICPPCGFVVHKKCIDLPYVIRISRHPHRISFTPSFNHASSLCGVCRKEICNDYGGYSCTKNGCSYVAHSRCATQKNVWDGKELEGVPEDDVGDINPFVRLTDGIIQHFSHQHHHLKLDENTDRNYDEDKLCQACITPIYSGNLYACLRCNFILHEECANFPRKMYHPIHPHLLTLRQQDSKIGWFMCSACPSFCADGLFYECPVGGCSFQVHVQCGVISEPLVHASHMHPLYLTSKPGENRECNVCKKPRETSTKETFNCLECVFSLCFGCATIPQKVRYKHDKHMFVLSYEKNETSMMALWCEICEGKIDMKNGFYTCDEDCCVTLHIRCTIGKTLYMKPGSSSSIFGAQVDILPNKKQMTRPICTYCKTRCPKASFGMRYEEGLAFCSLDCEIKFAINLERLDETSYGHCDSCKKRGLDCLCYKERGPACLLRHS